MKTKSENINKSIYQLSKKERLQLLHDQGLITPEEMQFLLENRGLSDEEAVKISENQLSTFALPYGIASNFLINGERYFIPMVTEEPSVVAAASKGAKIIAQHGGFRARSTAKELLGQIVTKEPLARVRRLIHQYQADIYRIVEEVFPNLIKRGGGLRKITAYSQKQFSVILLILNPCEAMGANIMNTILEKVSAFFREREHLEILMAILSNKSHRPNTRVTCAIPVVALGKTVAQKIADASVFASVDRYRQVTHNKGVMNGVEALVLACGNDTRSVYAGLVTRKARNLVTWKLQGDHLVGEFCNYFNLATVGGSLSLNKMAQISLKILRQPNAQKLAEIAGCVAVAQNFAALYALVTDGIQKGHMQLHARIIVEKLTQDPHTQQVLFQKLLESAEITDQKAKDLLSEIQKHQ